MKKIGIVMGSVSDMPVVEKAINKLRELEIPYEVHVYSAHRTPVEARDFSLNARNNGFGAIIAAAGMAAHLAGAIAANTTLPVIGIPSFIWCNLPACRKLRKEKGVSYYRFYPESNANFLGKLVSKEECALL